MLSLHEFSKDNQRWSQLDHLPGYYCLAKINANTTQANVFIYISYDNHDAKNGVFGQLEGKFSSEIFHPT